MKRSLGFSCLIIVALSSRAQFAEMLRPAGFVENMGQVKHADGTSASELLYRWQGDDFSIAFMRDRFVYEISYVHKDTLAAYKAAKQEKRAIGLRGGLHRIEYVFPAGPSTRLIAEGGTRSKIGYPDRVKSTSVRPMVHDRLVYKNAFPHADLVFSITADGQCKYDIVVEGGTELTELRFDVTGLEEGSMKMEDNQLTCELPFGRFVERVPEAYTMNGSARKSEHIAYTGSHRSIGFTAMDRPASAPMVIDPIGAIEWGTWFCPPRESLAISVIAAEDGVVYVAGDCQDGSLAYMTGTTYAGGGFFYPTDIWVARFDDVNGTIEAGDLVWCNIQGGTGIESAQDMDVCGDMVAVVGYTTSDAQIATIPMPFNGGNGPGTDGFLMYFDAVSGAVTLGSYVGGIYADIAHSVEFDCRPLASTRCYVAGNTTSGNVYPALNFFPSSFQNSPLCPGLSENAFLERHDAIGTVDMRTFYSAACGSYGTLVKDLDVDQNGNAIWVVRRTC